MGFLSANDFVAISLFNQPYFCSVRSVHNVEIETNGKKNWLKMEKHDKVVTWLFWESILQDEKQRYTISNSLCLKSCVDIFRWRMKSYSKVDAWRFIITSRWKSIWNRGISLTFSTYHIKLSVMLAFFLMWKINLL